MSTRPQSPLFVLAGLFLRAILQRLPEPERLVWLRCIVAALLLLALAALLLSGCTIQLDNHKLAITPLPGTLVRVTGSLTNSP
jgi:hypothetical protein